MISLMYRCCYFTDYDCGKENIPTMTQNMTTFWMSPYQDRSGYHTLGSITIQNTTTMKSMQDSYRTMWLMGRQSEKNASSLQQSLHKLICSRYDYSELGQIHLECPSCDLQCPP